MESKGYLILCFYPSHNPQLRDICTNYVVNKYKTTHRVFQTQFKDFGGLDKSVQMQTKTADMTENDVFMVNIPKKLGYDVESTLCSNMIENIWTTLTEHTVFYSNVHIMDATSGRTVVVSEKRKYLNSPSRPAEIFSTYDAYHILKPTAPPPKLLSSNDVSSTEGSKAIQTKLPDLNMNDLFFEDIDPFEDFRPKRIPDVEDVLLEKLERVMGIMGQLYFKDFSDSSQASTLELPTDLELQTSSLLSDMISSIHKRFEMVDAVVSDPQNFISLKIEPLPDDQDHPNPSNKRGNRNKKS
jgi:hypothetical protein